MHAPLQRMGANFIRDTNISIHVETVVNTLSTLALHEIYCGAAPYLVLILHSSVGESELVGAFCKCSG